MFLALNSSLLGYTLLCITQFLGLIAAAASAKAYDYLIGWLKHVAE